MTQRISFQETSKNEIADLTVAITPINSWNRINKAFRTIPGNYTPGPF